MAGRRSEFPTIHEMLSKVHAVDSKGKAMKTGRRARFLTDGVTPKPFPRREGLVVLRPEEILNVRVPTQHVTDEGIKGYQRNLIVPKARAIARWIISNPDDYMTELPVVEISFDDGIAFASEGQHRLVGAFIAGKPIRVVVTKRTTRQAKNLFTGQVKATRVNRNVIILDSEDSISEYIQDALTSDSHPWSGLISSGQTVSGGTNRISATSAYVMIQSYAVGFKEHRILRSDRDSERYNERFKKELADELAGLLLAFGDKQTNPFAFSALGLRAIARAARTILVDSESKPEDRERWERQMAKFPFAKFQYIRSSVDLSDQLIRWWNKSLPTARRVVID